MNGRKAKKMRREAEAQSVGAPARRLVLDGRALTRNGQQGRTAANDPESARAKYLRLKRGLKFHGALPAKTNIKTPAKDTTSSKKSKKANRSVASLLGMSIAAAFTRPFRRHNKRKV